jgi:hypothetical protein
MADTPGGFELDKKQRNKAAAGGAAAGGLAGAGTGLAMGSTIGTSIFPGIGTAVGAGVGALVGLVAGGISGGVSAGNAETRDQKEMFGAEQSAKADQAAREIDTRAAARSGLRPPPKAARAFMGGNAGLVPQAGQTTYDAWKGA